MEIDENVEMAENEDMESEEQSSREIGKTSTISKQSVIALQDEIKSSNIDHVNFENFARKVEVATGVLETSIKSKQHEIKMLIEEYNKKKNAVDKSDFGFDLLPPIIRRMFDLQLEMVKQSKEFGTLCYLAYMLSDTLSVKFYQALDSAKGVQMSDAFLNRIDKYSTTILNKNEKFLEAVTDRHERDMDRVISGLNRIHANTEELTEIMKIELLKIDALVAKLPDGHQLKNEMNNRVAKYEQKERERQQERVKAMQEAKNRVSNDTIENVKKDIEEA